LRGVSEIVMDEDESGSNILKIMTSERPILYYYYCCYYYVRRRRLYYYYVHPYVYTYNNNILLRSHTRLYAMNELRFRHIIYYYYHYNGHIIFGNIISRIKPSVAWAGGGGGGAGAINVVCRVIIPQPSPAGDFNMMRNIIIVLYV